MLFGFLFPPLICTRFHANKLLLGRKGEKRVVCGVQEESATCGRIIKGATRQGMLHLIRD
jgi:hypothetical protein